MQELQRAIDESANNKAAGEDDVPYEFLKHLGSKARNMLLISIRGYGEAKGSQKNG